MERQKRTLRRRAACAHPADLGCWMSHWAHWYAEAGGSFLEPNHVLFRALEGCPWAPAEATFPRYPLRRSRRVGARARPLRGAMLSNAFIPPDSILGCDEDGCMAPFSSGDWAWGLVQVLSLTFCYAYILFTASNMLSDGSELLLLVPSMAGIVGSNVLPILAAVPDGAIMGGKSGRSPHRWPCRWAACRRARQAAPQPTAAREGGALTLRRDHARPRPKQARSFSSRASAPTCRRGYRWASVLSQARRSCCSPCGSPPNPDPGPDHRP